MGIVANRRDTFLLAYAQAKNKGAPVTTEGPRKLPEGRRWVRSVEVVEDSFSGGTPSTKVGQYRNGEIPRTTGATITEDDAFLCRYSRIIATEVGAGSKPAPTLCREPVRRPLLGFSYQQYNE